MSDDDEIMILRVGEIVWLKSGGPAMTIKSTDKFKQPRCVWFNAAGDLKQSLFDERTITKSKPKSTVDSRK